MVQLYSGTVPGDQDEAVIHVQHVQISGFPTGSVSEESACSARGPGSIPGSGRSPREGNGNPLQDSCLENPMDRGAGWAAVHGVAESDMT